MSTFGDIFYKLVIVGDSGVGKSCLLSRFTYNEFLAESKSTIGVDFATKLLEINGKAIKVQIWDTAGQERFRAVSRVFYSKAAAAIIVYDVTNVRSFANIPKWITEVREKCEPNIKIMLVGNKIDLKHLTAVETEQGEEFAIENDIMFTETSAKDSTNVEDAFRDLVEKLHFSKMKDRRLSRKITRFIHLDFSDHNKEEAPDNDNEPTKCCNT